MIAKKATAILRLSCPDKRGIVAAVSRFVYEHNGNIIHSDQHNDATTDIFFLRCEWDLNNFSVPQNEIANHLKPITSRFDMDWQLHFSPSRARIGVLVSKVNHCLYELLLRSRSGEFPGDIVTIISNHEINRPIAEQFGIPFHHVDMHDRECGEEKQRQILAGAEVDLVVLARYMQILSPRFVESYPQQIINIHHSFLPAFAGARPYHQAYARGVKIIGATSHYVIAALDQGPIIGQDVTTVSHRDTPKDLIEKGRDLEKRVLSRAVKLHLEHKVLVFNNKTVIFD